MRNARVLFIALALAGVVSAWLIIRLLSLRFSQGDVYPPYSSLRADPLGVKALHDGLGRLPGIHTARNLDPLVTRQSESPHDSTYYFLGVYPGGRTPFGPRLGAFGDFPTAADVPWFDSLYREGGRVVVAFYPLAANAWTYEGSLPKSTTPTPVDAPPDSTTPPADATPAVANTDPASPDAATNATPDATPAPTTGNPPASTPPSLPVTFNFLPEPEGPIIPELGKIRLATAPAKTGPVDNVEDLHDSAAPMTARPTAQAPADSRPMPWHSAVYFDGLETDKWTVIYTRDDYPVVIERRIGGGTLVLCSDSFVFSNEALRLSRHSEFLIWTLGSKHRAVFNETHLGLQHDPGVATLARHYRLHGLAVGLLVLVLLFVWRSVTSLLPAPKSTTAAANTHVMTERDAQSGFANLLRRHVPLSQLVKSCFEQWRLAPPPGFGDQQARILRAADLFVTEDGDTPADRQPVQTYHAVCRILSLKDRPK